MKARHVAWFLSAVLLLSSSEARAGPSSGPDSKPDAVLEVLTPFGAISGQAVVQGPWGAFASFEAFDALGNLLGARGWKASEPREVGWIDLGAVVGVRLVRIELGGGACLLGMTFEIEAPVIGRDRMPAGPFQRPRPTGDMRPADAQGSYGPMVSTRPWPRFTPTAAGEFQPYDRGDMRPADAQGSYGPMVSPWPRFTPTPAGAFFRPMGQGLRPESAAKHHN
jgi:hypothetical protein